MKRIYIANEDMARTAAMINPISYHYTLQDAIDATISYRDHLCAADLASTDGWYVEGWDLEVDPDVDTTNMTAEEYFDAAMDHDDDQINGRDADEHKDVPFVWYAVMRDLDDDDWGDGSYDLDEARSAVEYLRRDYPEAYIAVITNGVCTEELR